jgi:tetratricopeptide (TPR) repeat protein
VNRKTSWAAVAAVLVATGAAYLPSIDGEFQYDDQEIAKTTWVRNVEGFLSPGAWTSMPRPLTGVTFAANHAMAGFRPRVWHLTNVLVHLAAVVLAWRFARRALERAGMSPLGVAAPPEEKGKGKRKAAAAAGVAIPEAAAVVVAGVFALHPIQTEAVSYISQRSEALASGLYLATLLALFAWDRAEPRRRIALAAAAIALHFLGLVAKPIAATVPAAWLVAAVFLPPRTERSASWWRRVVRRLPLAIPLVAMSLYAAVSNVTGTQGSGHAGFDLPFVTPVAYVATQMRALAVYLRLILVPAGLNADWSFPFSRGFSDPAALAGAAFVLALAVAAGALALRFATREGNGAAAARLAGFGVLFYFVVLAPTTLVPLRDPLVEHRVYLASLGILLALAGGAIAALGRLAPDRARVVGVVAACAVLAGVGTATALRNQVWTSAVALWSDASAKSPQKPRTWVNLGTAFHFTGRYEEAVRAYDRALALGYDPTVPLELVVRNTALALVRLRRYEDARERLVRYLARSPRDAGTIVILALVQVDTDRLDEAERSARQAMAIDPSLSRPHQILGQVFEKRADLEGALQQYATASRMDPSDPLPVYSMGRVEEKRGRIPQACSFYARAQDALARASAAKAAAEAYARVCRGASAAR